MSILQRRPTGERKLRRLPATVLSVDTPENMSCPNSPAVKKTYRLVICGSPRTGKSALVGRFLDRGYEDRYIPTIENFYRKMYKIKGEVYQLDIVDCSGNDPFPAARKLSYISGDMFIIVSSVDLPDSVERMIDIRQQIADCKESRGASSTSGETAVVFVCNKVELPEHRWQIHPDEIKQTIEETFGTADNFITCSAATDMNIDKVFGMVFARNKCPKHMNPEVHKMLRNELSADGENRSGKKHLLQKMRERFSRETEEPLQTYTDLNARRPSLRTDLLMNRAKTSVIHQHVHPRKSRNPREEAPPPPPSTSTRCIIM